MERSRRTSWTDRPRPRHASAHAARPALLVSIIVSPASTSTSYPHTSSKPSVSGSITLDELNRQTRVFKNDVTSTKQRTATCSNRQKIKFRLPDNLQTSLFNQTAVRESVRPAFRAFLTGSAPQTEFPVTHSKQTTGKFLTGSRTAIKRNTISTLKTQKLAPVISHPDPVLLPQNLPLIELIEGGKS
jgi:hypothetical protein